MTTADTAARKKGNGKGAFYRLMRAWHAYLSAFAFIALIFFSVTGLLLNHPEWLKGLSAGSEDRVITLPAPALQAAQKASDPAAAVGQMLDKATTLNGAYASGEILDGEALLRFEGASGSSDATVDLESGRAEVTVRRANAVTTLNDLHRGKNAGAVWRGVIDATAYLLLAMSLVGYILFFSLRFRLATSLTLTALSLAVLAGVFFVFVP